MSQTRQRRAAFCVAGLVLSVGSAEPAPVAPDVPLMAIPPVTPHFGLLEAGPHTATAPNLLPSDWSRSEWEVSVPDGRWTLRADASRDLVVADRFGTDVAVHDLPDGDAAWTVHDVYIDEGRMIVSEHRDMHGDYRVWVYELDTGDRRTLDPWNGSPDLHRLPRLALTRSWLAWEVSQDNGELCVMVENLASRERFEPVCVASSAAMPTSRPAGSE